MMLYLAKDKLDLFFEKASEKRSMYVPVDAGTGATYKKWEPGTVVSKALHTTKIAKDFFFPQMENLMEFKTNGKNIEVIDTRSETEDFVIFGTKYNFLIHFNHRLQFIIS